MKAKCLKKIKLVVECRFRSLKSSSSKEEFTAYRVQLSSYPLTSYIDRHRDRQGVQLLLR